MRDQTPEGAKSTELPAVLIRASYRNGGGNTLLFPCGEMRSEAGLLEQLLEQATQATLKSKRKDADEYCFETFPTLKKTRYKRTECVRYVLIDADQAKLAELDEANVGCFALLFETKITELGREGKLPRKDGKPYQVSHFGIVDRADVERLLKKIREVRAKCCPLSGGEKKSKSK